MAKTFRGLLDGDCRRYRQRGAQEGGTGEDDSPATGWRHRPHGSAVPSHEEPGQTDAQKQGTGRRRWGKPPPALGVHTEGIYG